MAGKIGAKYGNQNAKGNGLGGKIGQATTGVLFGGLAGAGLHSGIRAARGKTVHSKSAALGSGLGSASFAAMSGADPLSVGISGAIGAGIGYGASKAGGAIGKKIASRKKR